ncbi:MAG: hypothetical protein ACFFBP_16375 [Promethearchaeota archaeon]
MAEKINLKDLERKAWKSFFQDGLWDIYFGLILLGLAASQLLYLLPFPELINLFIVLIPIYSIAMLILTLGKKYITTPRIGKIKFGLKRKKIKKRLAIIILIQVGFTVSMVILTSLGLFYYLQINSLILMLIIGLLFLTFPIGILAFYWDYPRLYIYGLLGGMGFFIAELLHPIIGEPLNLILPYSCIATSIIIVGLVYFLKFLHKYPKVN